MNSTRLTVSTELRVLSIHQPVYSFQSPPLTHPRTYVRTHAREYSDIPREFADAVRVFSSESALIDYVRSEDYDRRSGTPFFAESKSGADIDGTAMAGLSGQSSQEQGGEEGHDKVGMAVIFNEAPLEGEVPRWDYTLRLNYTYGISQFGEQVSNYT